jgi:sodium-dependent dicarboxylate transporter 2/3/5
MASSLILNRQKTGLLLGTGLFLLALLAIPDSAMPAASRNVAAVALLMGTLWVTEAIPIPITSLLPIILFPLLDVMPVSVATSQYANHIVFLFLGGFWIAAAIERCKLHRRIALHVLLLVGSSADRVILGFMAATAFLSMWLSNTATTMMMLPIAMAVLSKIGTKSNTEFHRSLMLGIAYAASIGGVATLIGTPPNAVLAGIAEKTIGIAIPFWKWFLFGLPLSLIMLGICWFFLTRVYSKLNNQDIGHAGETIACELTELGSITRAEQRVLMVFSSVAFLWIFKGILPFSWADRLSDSMIAIAGAFALFVIPCSADKKSMLLDWQTAKNIPWDILILFGGGFALAQGFQQSGLMEWIGLQLEFVHAMHWIVLVITVTVITIFMTEMTSNTATATILLPIVAGIALAAGHNALIPMVSTALAASFAFMLPVATPPNAIVFSSRQITIAEMIHAGIWMNLTGIVLIVIFVSVIFPVIWKV